MAGRKQVGVPGASIEVAPDVIVSAAVAVAAEPKFIAIASWQEVPFPVGAYRPVLILQDIPTSPSDLAAALGIPGRVIAALCDAGFLNRVEITPNAYGVDWTNWSEHIARMQGNPKFWKNVNRRNSYRGCYVAAQTKKTIKR